ncbi:DNA-binding transcriptional regulator, LysR family [Virgibacillus chiguensis]|uniref:DNA-binding transcriptional regulator, LysR family n=1 Tax=Virgibacillus chiguensis TaxID=411959 RepID=A0A1M5TVA0_9BACI|nr:DNA-binding transcriptional regulator, LysR family [Virgibacillus chiguensis]
MIELHHLRYFIVVAEELHFGKAALRLQMTQPPLSQQIKHLEREIGVTLLKRSKRTVTLTTAGKVFLKHVKQGLAQIDYAVDMAKQTERGESGELKIGFVGSATFEILPPLIRKYQKRFPSVKIGLQELSTANQVKGLLNGSIDIGILHPPIKNDDLILHTVKKDNCVLVVPKGHSLALKEPVHLKDLHSESMIFISKETWPYLYSKFNLLCKKAGFTPNIHHESTEYHMIISLVSAGLGVSIVPSTAKKSLNFDVVYKEIENFSLDAEWVTAHKKDNQNPALLNFTEALHSYL